MRINHRRRCVLFSAAAAALSLVTTTAHASFAIDWVADDYSGNGTWTSSTANGAGQIIAATQAGSANTPGVLANAFGTHAGVDFSPGSTYLEAPANTTPIGEDPANFTVAVAFKATDVAATSGNAFFNGRLIFGNDSPGGGTPDWCFSYGGANKQSVFGSIGSTGTNGGDHAFQTGSLDLNVVHAAVMVVNATAGTQSVFIDGKLVGTATGLTIVPRTNPNIYRIGGGYFNGAFEGQIAELRVYDDAGQNGALLSSQLANAYGGTYGVQQLFTWNAGSAAWGTGSNWDVGTVPNDIGYHQALINNGGTVTIGASDSFSVSDLWVGTSSTGSGHVVQTGGTLNVGNSIKLGSSGGTASYEMNGATFNYTGANALAIGDGATGSVIAQGASQINSSTAETWIGNGTGGVGTFTQTGGTTTVNNWVTIGRQTASGSFVLNNATFNKQGGGNTFVDEAGGGTSVMTLLGSSQYNALTGEFWVGQAAGGTGTLNLQDTSSVTVSSNWVAIGRSGGSGTVSMTGTTTFSKTGGNGSNFILADGGGSVANFTVADNASVNVGVGELWVGQNGGVGNLNIQNNGSVSANNWFAVGRNNGTGTVNLSDNGRIFKTGNGNITVGADGSTGGGSINQTGGTINAVRSADPTQNGIGGGEVYLGELTTGRGTWNFSGGSANVPVLSVGLNGQGTFNMSGSATLTTGSLGVARGGTFGSVANLDGGTITTGAIFRGASTGAPSVNLNGTTIISAADNDHFVAGFNSNELIARAGGAILDTNGKNVGFDSGISGTGSFTKKGAGVLSINPGANNTYSGATIINAGTVKLGKQQAVYDNNLLAKDVSAFYKFDDSSNLGKDSSPNAANASATSTFGLLSVTNSPPQPLPGHSGVLNLAGNTGDFLSTDDSNTPSDFPLGNSSYTLAAWIDLDGTNTSLKNGIIGWGSQGAGGIQRSSNTFRTDNNGTTPNRLLNGWFIVDNAANTPANLTNEWHHVTATYDAVTDIRKLYVDGTLIAAQGDAGVNNASSINFAIGRSTLSAEFFAGYMADMLVARSALTASQIQSLMANGITFGSFTGAASSGALSPNSLVQLASGATLDLNGASTPSGGLGNVAGSGGLVTSSSAGSAVLGLNPVGMASFSGVIEDGAGTVGISKSGAGAQVLTGNNTYTGTTTAQGGALVLSSDGSQATVFTAGRGGADITGGRVVFDYNTATDRVAQIKTMLHDGFNEPTKFATGAIRSSTATSAIGLGYINDAVAKQMTVAYAYYGDSNLDGRVNALDFNALATNFGQSSKEWVQGDFNYDGTVNSLDFNALAGNFNQALPAPAPALGALVPEPGALVLLSGVWALTLRRRRGRG